MFRDRFRSPHKGLLSRAFVLLALIGSTATCRDLNFPEPFRSKGLLRNIEVPTASLQINLLYDGRPFSQLGLTSNFTCYSAIIDGTGGSAFCGSDTVSGLKPGEHTILLRRFDYRVRDFVTDAGPVTVSLVAGQTTQQNFDFSGQFGLLTGRLTVNGQPVQGTQSPYFVCGDGGCDGDFDADGTFDILVRPGSGTGTVHTYTSPDTLRSFEYTSAVGTVTAVGEVSVMVANLRINLLYDGQSFSQLGLTSNFACYSAVIDGTGGSAFCGSGTVSGLKPGEHTILLLRFDYRVRDFVTDAGPVTVSLVAGQTTQQNFDFSGQFGLLTGRLTVNGQPVQGTQSPYFVCGDGGCDGDFDADGTFDILVRPGSGTGTVHNHASSDSLAVFHYEGVTGGTLDVGAIEVGGANLQINLLYDGRPFSQLGLTSNFTCYSAIIDGTGGSAFCGSGTVSGLKPGEHTILLRRFDYRVRDFVTDAGPVTVSLVAGQTTQQNFDFSGQFGLLTGRLTVNGQPVQGTQSAYFVCGDGGCDGDFDADGTFSIVVRPGSGRGTVHTYASPDTLAIFSYTALAGQTTLVGTVDGGAAGYTPTGTAITIKPVDPATSTTPVTLQFTTVTVAGNTQVRTGRGGPTPPNGTRPGSPTTYYTIETTATFTGSVLVCINYDDTAFGNEGRLKLYHADASGTWTDVTTTRDTAANVVCGSVTSFSPFLIAETNAAPAVESVAIQDGVVPLGSGVGVRAAFADVNPRDQHTATMLWDDGTSSAGAVAESSGSGTVSGVHGYAAPGVYTIRVRVSDGLLEGERSSSSDLPAYAVVYDPSAGFVTGGGWILSPAGACRFRACSASTSGRASFGFVSRYRLGATAPTGNTEFEFRAGGLDFQSGSYDWLVVAGARAQFKGRGQINGQGDFGFLVTAIDGALVSGGGADRFRIKIWDRSSGAVVYDNRMGADEDGGAATELGGGSIVIHR